MSKKEIIEQAALKVFVTRGLYDAPMAYIAKEADVPVGSIYTYFESKEALINTLFLKFKQAMGQFIFSPVPPDLSIYAELKLYWMRAMQYGLDHPEGFFFAEQFSNSPMVQPVSRETVRANFEKVYRLLDLGIQNGTFKAMDPDLLHHLIYTNITSMIKYLSLAKLELDTELEDHLFQCCWDGICVR
jgi:AcrR family transcriptional regulator